MAVKTHLDRHHHEHHGAHMRTTVTLDKDVERLLRRAMHSRRKSFKETLNDAIRVVPGRPTSGPRAFSFCGQGAPHGAPSRD
jgi:hypothetical protein